MCIYAYIFVSLHGEELPKKLACERAWTQHAQDIQNSRKLLHGQISFFLQKKNPNSANPMQMLHKSTKSITSVNWLRWLEIHAKFEQMVPWTDSPCFGPKEIKIIQILCKCLTKLAACRLTFDATLHLRRNTKEKKKQKKNTRGLGPLAIWILGGFVFWLQPWKKKSHGKGGKCICSSFFLVVLCRPRLHRCRADPRKMCSKFVNLNQKTKKAKKKKCWGGGLANHFFVFFGFWNAHL